MSDLLVDSVQFGAESDFEVMTFGNQKIKIWKPISAVDDSDMSELPGDQTLQGMVKEVGNLRDMEAGDLMTLDGVEKLKRDNPEVNFRTIGCRWVTARKTVDTVRSRIVVKDVAEKNMPSARSLGISSPTPSSDAMFLLLGLAGCRDYAIGSADIAHAFMATPLRVRDVIIKLPLSVSAESTNQTGIPLSATPPLQAQDVGINGNLHKQISGRLDHGSRFKTAGHAIHFLDGIGLE